MKKVGLLTIHRARNYGAALQSYATLKILTDMGFEAEIIDYSVTNTISGGKFILLPVSFGNIKHNIKNLLHPFKFFKKKKRFDAFLDEHFILTSKTYKYGSHLGIADEDVDFLITGSDQTFALNLGGSIAEREVFFLPFKTSARKISYASSMGEKTSLLTDQQKEFMSVHLADYKALSVRENVAADLTEKLIGRRPEVIFDPTLTISRDEWDRVAKPNPVEEKYILFYSVLSDRWVVEYVKRVSKETGLPVIALHNRNRYEADSGFCYMDECGPGEFITMIKNAEFVLTSSFHGTAFALIYEKPFLSFKLGEGNRICSLLKKADLERFIICEENKNEMLIPEPLDSMQIKKFLKTAREVNEAFLKKAIE